MKISKPLCKKIERLLNDDLFKKQLNNGHFISTKFIYYGSVYKIEQTSPNTVDLYKIIATVEI